MSDGTTGFQVAPTEEAMKLSKALQFAADAITNHSGMRQELESLRSEIARVRSDLDASHTHSQELDQTIHELRQQRDEARGQASTLERDLGWRSHDLDNAQRTISEQQTQIGSLTDALTSAKKDRDEYGMKMMALEDQVETWKGRAEQARAKLADMASLFKVDEPEPPKAPEPEPTPAPMHPEPGAVSLQTDPPQAVEDKPWWSRDNDPSHVTEAKPTTDDDEIPF